MLRLAATTPTAPPRTSQTKIPVWIVPILTGGRIYCPGPRQARKIAERIGTPIASVYTTTVDTKIPTPIATRCTSVHPKYGPCIWPACHAETRNHANAAGMQWAVEEAP